MSLWLWCKVGSEEWYYLWELSKVVEFDTNFVNVLDDSIGFKFSWCLILNVLCSFDIVTLNFSVKTIYNYRVFQNSINEINLHQFRGHTGWVTVPRKVHSPDKPIKGWVIIYSFIYILYDAFQLVPAESSISDTQSQCTDSQAGDIPKLPAERLGGIGDSRPPSFQ